MKEGNTAIDDDVRSQELGTSASPGNGVSSASVHCIFRPSRLPGILTRATRANGRGHIVHVSPAVSSPAR